MKESNSIRKQEEGGPGIGANAFLQRNLKHKETRSKRKLQYSHWTWLLILMMNNEEL